MSVEDFMEKGGNEGAEVIMWLIMRGALDKARRGCTRITISR